MANEKTAITLVIDAKNLTSPEIEKAIADAKRMAAELNKTEDAERRASAEKQIAEETAKLKQTLSRETSLILAQDVEKQVLEAKIRYEDDVAKFKQAAEGKENIQRELTAYLAAREKQYHQEVAAIQDKGKKGWAEYFGSAGKGIKGVVAGLFSLKTALAGAGLYIAINQARRLAAEFNNISQGMEDMLNLSNRLGLPVEFLDKLSFSAKDADVDINSLAQSIQYFQRQVFEFVKTGKGESGPFLKALGLDKQSLVDAAGNIKPVEELFYAISDRLASIGNDTERNAIGMRLFGRGAGDALRYIAQGSDAIKTSMEGIIPLTREQAEEADRYNREVEELNREWMEFKRIVVIEALPGAKQLLEDIIGYLTSHRGDIEDVANTIASIFSAWGFRSDTSKAMSEHMAKITALKGEYVELGKQIENVKDLIKVEESINAGKGVPEGRMTPGQLSPYDPAYKAASGGISELTKYLNELQNKAKETKGQIEELHNSWSKFVEPPKIKAETSSPVTGVDFASEDAKARLEELAQITREMLSESAILQKQGLDREIEQIRQAAAIKIAEHQANYGELKEYDAAYNTWKKQIENETESQVNQLIEEHGERRKALIVEIQDAITLARKSGVEREIAQLSIQYRNEINEYEKRAKEEGVISDDLATLKVEKERELQEEINRIRKEQSEIVQQAQADIQNATEILMLQGRDRALAQLRQSYEREVADQQKALEEKKITIEQFYNWSIARQTEYEREAARVRGDFAQGVADTIADMQAEMSDHYAQAQRIIRGLEGLFSSGMQGFFDDLISGTVKVEDAFKRMVTSILQDIARLVMSELISRPIAGLIAGGISSLFGGLFGGGSGIGGGQAGGYTSTIGGSTYTTGVYAKGGIIDRPTVSLMGESGPEAVIPLSGGRGIPVIGGQQKTVHISFTILANDTAGFDSLLMKRRDIIKSMIADAVNRDSNFRQKIKA